MKMKSMALALALVLPLGFGSANAAVEEIEIVGTGDGMSVLRSIGDAYSSTVPDVAIIVPDSIGSGGGVKAVGKDKYKVGRVARKIKDKEAHYGLEYRPFAKVPVVFFVKNSVGVENLTAQQIIDIYSGKIANWSKVGGRDLPVYVVRREDGDSSLGVLRKSFPGFAELEITADAKEAVSTPEIFDVVSRKQGAIGFGPYSGAMEAGMKIFRVDGRSATNSGYPSFGTIALIFKSENYNGKIGGFIDFATSAAAHEAITKAYGIPY